MRQNLILMIHLDIDKTVTTDHCKNDKTRTVTYTYDNVGNRLKEDDGTTTTSYIMD